MLKKLIVYKDNKLKELHGQKSERKYRQKFVANIIWFIGFILVIWL